MNASIALVTLLLAGLGLSGPAVAQAVQPKEAVVDAGLYFTAPLHWDTHDWMNAGGTLLAVIAARGVDSDVRDHFVDSDEPLTTTDDNGARDFLPAVLMIGGTWLFAGVLDSDAGYRELGSMLEAGTLTGASTALLRWGLGRERPNETDDPDRWFSGGDAMPSLHVSTTFAVGTVFAESGSDDYRWLRRVLGYGSASAVAYLRVKDNQHWTSDAVAGAALGYFSATFVMHRRDAGASHSALTLMPQDGGLVLSYSQALQ
jgi:hypothetical protein